MSAFGGAGGLAAGAAGALGPLGLMGGGMALANSTSPLGGALAGGVAGAGLTATFGGAFEVATGLGAGTFSAGALAALGGPIGIAAVLGGIAIGAIVGALGRGKARQQASQIEQQYEFAADAIFTQFQQHQVDYQSALTGMQNLITQGQQAEMKAGLGSAGKAGAQNLAQVIAQEISDLNQLEGQRNSTAVKMSRMTVPEFAVGGLVGGGSGGGILALVHPGEFVMRQAAVDSIGANVLSALNSAPRFAAGGLVSAPGSRAAGPDVSLTINALYIQAWDASSIRQAQPQITDLIRRAMWDGAL